MPKTSDIKLGSDPLMCLFKGRAKTRKTTAAASFPGPIYFADCDGRIDVVKKEFPDREDIEYDSFTNFSDIIKKKNEFLKDCPFKTIVFPDSLTFFVEMLMNYAISARGGNSKTSAEVISRYDDSPVIKTITNKAHKAKGEISLLEIDDYMAETRMISELLDDLKIIRLRHKVNVIVTAHVIEKQIRNLKGEVTETQQYLIAYGSKVVDKIPAAFNEVFHFSVEPGFEIGTGSKFMCTTQNNGKDFAGTSLPGVPAQFDWSGKNFYETLMGYVRKD